MDRVSSDSGSTAEGGEISRLHRMSPAPGHRTPTPFQGVNRQ